jgi:hypothetical protein
LFSLLITSSICLVLVKNTIIFGLALSQIYNFFFKIDTQNCKFCGLCKTHFTLVKHLNPYYFYTLLCVRYSFFNFHFFNFHFFNPPNKNSEPIINATIDWIVSDVVVVPLIRLYDCSPIPLKR